MKKITQTIYHSLVGTIGAGAILLLASGASAQNVFVSDYSTGDIYEYTSQGSSPITFYSGFSNPAGLAFDSEGDLFAAVQGGAASIYEFVNSGGTLSHTPTLFASGFNTPASLAFDSTGDLFIANAGSNNIIEISSHGVRSTFASGGYLDYPLGLAFNTAGDLFAGNSASSSITEITPGGVQSNFASTGLSGPGLGLAFNSVGDLFVGNVNGYGTGSITEITPNGVTSPFASGFGTPNAMAFTSTGELLVDEGLSSNILGFNTNAQSSVYDSGASNPNGLAIQGLNLPVPEPSVLALISIGGAVILSRRFRKNA